MPADLDPPARTTRPGAVAVEDLDAEARPRASAMLLDAVQDLRRDVAVTRFPLRLPGADQAEDRRRQLLDQLDDHLLPRLRELSAPAVVVVAGSTGAGKSTLVNSVLGAEVSAAGVLRPTTRRPVMAHHPADADLLAEHPLMDIVEVVVREEVPRGIALVDAPDLDSLLASNRSTAHRLLDAADLWVFVTTAARYGDAVPWEVLGQAAERGTSTAMVLNRVPADALVDVRGDLLARLRERGMSTVPLFLVPDQGPHQGLLDRRVVAPIVRWLTMLAGSDRARSVIQRTQRGTLRSLRPWADELAEAVQAQVDARVALEEVVRAAVTVPAEASVAAVASGAIAEGPVRARWVAVGGGTGPLAGRWSRRGRDARAEALAGLADELRTSATVVLTAARRYGDAAVLGALADCGLPGAEAVVELLEGPEPVEVAAPVVAPTTSAEQWVDAAATLLDQRVAGDRQVAALVDRLVRGAGREGAAVLLCGAASGLGAARAMLSSVLGTDLTQDLVGTVADDAQRRTREQAVAGAERALAVLAAPDLADDASSRLRLRLAVLKGLT